MQYLLDTNACIKLLNRDPTVPIAQKINTLNPRQIHLCTIVTYELYYGAHKSQRRDRNLNLLNQFTAQFQVLPFDTKASRIAGEIRANLEQQGTPIGQNDLKIAAIAVANDFTLVTHNTREFERIDGLKVEDWEV